MPRPRLDYLERRTDPLCRPLGLGPLIGACFREPPGNAYHFNHGRSQKFNLGGYNFYCTILQSYILAA